MKQLGFKASLLTAITSLMILSLLVSSYLSYSLLKQQITLGLTDDIHHTIDTKVSEIQASFSRTTAAVTELAALYKQGEHSNDHVKMTQYTAKLGGVVKVIIGFDDGSSFVSKASESFPDGVGIPSKYDPRSRPWYQAGKRNGVLSLSDVFFTRSEGIPMVGVMHPIQDGIIMADLRFDQLQQQLDSLSEIEGATGFIIDKQGLVLASNTRFINQKDNIKQSENLLDVFSAVVGRDESFETVEIESIATLIASQKIPLLGDNEWYVVTVVDEAVAFAPLTAATYKLAMIIALAVIVSVLILLFVMNKLYQPINKLRDLVTELGQGNADLTQRLEVNNDDDIGKIASGINNFISQLQTMLVDINNATLKLSNGVNTLQQYSRSSEQILVQHSSETTQIVTAIEELSNTAVMVAEHTSSAAQYTSDANQTGELSIDTIKSTQQKIQALAAQIHETSSNIENMNNETSSIQSIVEVIGSIAEQTNLLALNASIEAARAGDQGRGFAVVADEVRALASRTQTSTSEIETALSKLKNEASLVVSSIGSTEHTCNDTVGEAANTSDNLQEMSVIVTKINELNSQVSTSANEQNVVIQDINKSMHQIHDMVEKLNNEGSLQRVETENIATINRDLSDMIGKFRL
ncbi:methyl-accepting chemotaxis protein [Agarivorans sp. MS3-6]|uniref:methyl-accepting chemotaxis protein n=1 Tax=Agarivorans sp. TSD2052 TaxID=2937286 RepID=UPI00200DDA69|nr:methyl-accepting chemotaxis protein [Agarivorans sp. TSD2052]UPW20388.1 methyl-accepting chemotaxis protein [Agarivorans sp. TSD2052]